MRYGVVACPRCRKARVFESGRKTAECGHCGRRLKLDALRIFHRADTPEEAQAAVGAVNADLAGQSDAYRRALAEAASARAFGGAGEDEDAEARAISRVRRATGGEVARVEAAIAALGDADEWDADALGHLLAESGLKHVDVEDAITRLKEKGLVIEPRHGWYRSV